MSDCNNCQYKNDRCFCPPGRECMAFEKKIHKVKCTFTFTSTDNWSPGEGSCVTGCPFSVIVELGKTCRGTATKGLCPFLQGRYNFLVEEIKENKD